MQQYRGCSHRTHTQHTLAYHSSIFVVATIMLTPWISLTLRQVVLWTRTLHFIQPERNREGGYRRERKDNYSYVPQTQNSCPPLTAIKLHVYTHTHTHTPCPNWPPWVAKASPWKPSWWQTMAASLLSQLSSQTVPHTPLWSISTRPSMEVLPPTRRTGSPWIPPMEEMDNTQISHMHTWTEISLLLTIHKATLVAGDRASRSSDKEKHALHSTSRWEIDRLSIWKRLVECTMWYFMRSTHRRWCCLVTSNKLRVWSA